MSADAVSVTLSKSFNVSRYRLRVQGTDWEDLLTMLGVVEEHIAEAKKALKRGKVLRFTGTDIWRDGFACATDIIKAIGTAYKRAEASK